MKLFVSLVMLAALFLLYRIAFPKQPEAKKENNTPPKREFDLSDVVIKSRFVPPDIGQPRTTPATILKTDFQEEKAVIFAAGNEEKRSAVVPPEKLDEAFANEPNPDDLDIFPDEEEEERLNEEDLEEEAEDLRQTMGEDAEPASGWSIEEMTEAAKAIAKPTDEKAAVLYRVEKSDLFEQLLSGDEGKAAAITAIIERHIR